MPGTLNVPFGSTASLPLQISTPAPVGGVAVTLVSSDATRVAVTTPIVTIGEGRSVIVRAYLFLGPLEAVACMCGYFWVMYGGGWQWGEMLSPREALYRQATTACLAGIVVAQVGNVFACRSSRESVFTIGLLSNRLVLSAVAVEVVLLFAIVYTPVGNMVFGTSPLGLEVWLVLAPFSVAILAAEEMRKRYLKKVA